MIIFTPSKTSYNSRMVEKQLKENTIKLALLVDNLVDITREIGHDQLNETLVELGNQLEAPFTFVIVGEVKAGKSSFINALLESKTEICKVAAAPMTDTIQLIVYGEEEKIESLNPYLKKIYLPVEVLREIAIVDTPGTNSIVSHHQEITERFIPYSDLVVFVFEAKNPYRQSSWEFFDFINEEWRRKIIFVLQQKDLVNQQDLDINIDGLSKYAKEKGISAPNVFPVSAKMELEHLTNESGFLPLRKYILDNITSGQAPMLKFQNNVNTLSSISDKLDRSMQNRIKQYESDLRFRDEIRELINTQHAKTAKQIAILTENLVDSYDNITSKKLHDLEDGLSFMSVLKRSFSSIFGKESSLKEWLNNQANDFEVKLNTSLKDKLQNGIIDVADNIQTMGKLVDNKLRYSETILKNNDEIFADIAERRTNVLRDLQVSFQQFMNKSENFYDQNLLSESSKMTPNLAAGGGVAIVGVILAAVANGAVFDITGGVLTAVGVLFAGVTLGLNRSKVLKRFETEISKGRNLMQEEVNEKLSAYTDRIKQKIEANFYEFDQLLITEGSTINTVAKVQKEVRMGLSDLKN